MRPSTALTRTGYLSFVLIGWNAVLVPSLIRSIEHDFRQQDAAVGLFYFLSSLLYAGGAALGGFLTERLGRRAVLSAGALLLGIGLAGEAAAPVWPALIAGALVLNWGAGAIDGGVNGLFLDLFRDARGGAMNLLHLFFGVGALVSPFVVGRLVAAGVSWRAVLLGTGVAAALLSLRLITLDMPAGRHVPVPPEDRAQITGRERSLLPFAGLAAAICFYVASEIGVSNWLVRFLGSVPATTATAVLSGFWGGLALGRLLSNRIADRFDYVPFTVTCALAAGAATVAAVLAPSFGLSAALFGLAGLFSGPVYPMIVAIGGDIYPHRLSALSGGLSSAAVVGSIAYPPLMGVMAGSLGLRWGMLGAGLLGIPAAAAILYARLAARTTQNIVSV